MKILSKFFIITLIATSIFSPVLTLADNHVGGDTGGGSAGGSAGSVVDNPEDVLRILKKIADWMLTVFMVLAVIFILLAAFKYLTSKGGDGVQDAHKMILYAVVAVAVAILAPGIVNLVEAFLK